MVCALTCGACRETFTSKALTAGALAGAPVMVLQEPLIIAVSHLLGLAGVSGPRR